MKMRGLLLLTALAVASLTGSARADYDLLGAGGTSCGSWTDNRADSRMVNVWLSQGQWVMGFLSGVGYTGIAGLNPLHGVDANGVAGWLDNYCRAHPLQDLGEAAAAFIQEHPR